MRDSRHSMIASVAATALATTLAQSGTTKPLIVTSQPSATRNNWSNATSEKTATATILNGFNRASVESVRSKRSHCRSARGHPAHSGALEQRHQNNACRQREDERIKRAHRVKACANKLPEEQERIRCEDFAAGRACVEGARVELGIDDETFRPKRQAAPKLFVGRAAPILETKSARRTFGL